MLENTVTEETSPKKPDRNLLNFIKNQDYLHGLSQSDINKVREDINSLAYRVS